MADVTKFLSGIANFQQEHFGDNPELAKNLLTGQKPQALLIGCCDSRVDPALLTDSAPGDLFILRNIANLVPPYTKSDDFHGVSSSIEYAVCFLEVSDIIILGHSNCGGIGALMDSAAGEEAGEFIGKWVSIAASARDKVMTEMSDLPEDKKARACESDPGVDEKPDDLPLGQRAGGKRSIEPARLVLQHGHRPAEILQSADRRVRYSR